MFHCSYGEYTAAEGAAPWQTMRRRSLYCPCIFITTPPTPSVQRSRTQHIVMRVPSRSVNEISRYFSLLFLLIESTFHWFHIYESTRQDNILTGTRPLSQQQIEDFWLKQASISIIFVSVLLECFWLATIQHTKHLLTNHIPTFVF